MVESLVSGWQFTEAFMGDLSNGAGDLSLPEAGWKEEVIAENCMGRVAEDTEGLEIAENKYVGVGEIGEIVAMGGVEESFSLAIAENK